MVDPLHARAFIESHFFAPSHPHADVHRVQPLGMSYAGHAAFEGAKRLAWKYDEVQKKYVNDGKNGGHVSLIVGCRWNANKNVCQYKVKNTWTVKHYPAGYEQAAGNPASFWILDHYLFRSINRFDYLTDQLGNP